MMKLSEAIRLGSMAWPKGDIHLFDGESACSIGAALLAVGEKLIPYETKAKYNRFCELWPEADTNVMLPDTNWSVPLIKAIWSLNDGYRWSRERIADWVESLEKARESQEVQTSGLTNETVSEEVHAHA